MTILKRVVASFQYCHKLLNKHISMSMCEAVDCLRTHQKYLKNRLEPECRDLLPRQSHPGPYCRDIKIRAMKIDEVEIVANRLSNETFWTLGYEQLLGAFNSTNGKTWHTAEHEKRLVGCIGFVIHGKVAVLTFIYVLPEFRNRGIGRKLLMHQENVVRALRFDRYTMVVESFRIDWARTVHFTLEGNSVAEYSGFLDPTILKCCLNEAVKIPDVNLEEYHHPNGEQWCELLKFDKKIHVADRSRYLYNLYNSLTWKHIYLAKDERGIYVGYGVIQSQGRNKTSIGPIYGIDLDVAQKIFYRLASYLPTTSTVSIFGDPESKFVREIVEKFELESRMNGVKMFKTWRVNAPLIRRVFLMGHPCFTLL